MEINFSEYFATLSACATTTLLVSGYIITHILKTINSTGRQITSWFVAVGLAFLAQWMGWGIFVGEGAAATLLNGLGIGLVANGIFDVSFVQAILEGLKAKLPK